MAMKRKFDGDSDDAVYQNTKQLKLVPFPNYEPDKDCTMSEAQPFYEHYHFRNTSSASSASSYASGSPTTPPSSFPSIEPYPLSLLPDVSMSSVSYTNQVSISNVGLLQPHTDFKHHGSSCSTIPKLRVACAPGLNGNRTMWSFCEECGAISMVNSD
ncbi:hypothetical protein GGU11DRAFT_569908 [Lentinula aff. detonsa]|uniref:Uncharacterized protein n=1 Tax=Lentinula aff. detonsa TaxID=2804958 RepID=A0AA38KY49_9AGAR|nr:hypothetical protein GGU10DRAFT_345630 [Lentinula aff. detonsa]KAJ3798613.1 hypothetical protein GGU11DRAFT_569908 [Lentinula aff. detonsa]